MSTPIDKSTWTKIKFGELAQSITERVDDPASCGMDRYVGLEHLDPRCMTVKRWDSPEAVTSTKLKFQPGDVIFGRRRAYQKKVARADFAGICSAHALVLRARPERMLPEFLPVFMSSDAFLDRAVQISVGSLSPTVNWGTLAQQEFLVPPLDEQKRIAELLWLTEEYSESIAERRAILSALHAALLTETIDNWQGSRVALSDVAELSRGVSYATSDFQEDGLGRPLLNLKCVTRDASFAPGGVKWVREGLGADRLAQAGDLFVACTDLTPGRLLVGAPFYFDGYASAMAPTYSMDLARIRSKTDDFTLEMLFLALCSPAARRFARVNTAGSTVGHLNLSAITLLQVPPATAPFWNDLLARTAAARSALEELRLEEKRILNARTALLEVLV